MTFFTSQKQAADPGASCWVAASAGTGKTKVLIDRLARLLLLGFQAKAILCITFTKAAATEMQQRLLKKLQSWAVADLDELIHDLHALLGHAPDESVIRRAQDLFFLTLDTPGGLKIQTIHSFCQGLLQRFPLEADIDPCFTLIEETQAHDLLRQAQQRLLQNPSPSLQNALDCLTAELSESRFEESLQSLQNQRAQFYEFLNYYSDLDTYQELLQKRFIKKPSSPAPVDWALLCATLTHYGTEADQKLALALQPYCHACASVNNTSVFLTQEGQIRQKLVSKHFERNFPDLFQTLYQFANFVYQHDQYVKTCLTVDITVAFCQVAQAIFEAYQATKQQQGLLDFQDLITLTHRLLKKPHISDWVFYKLDGGFDHILIDEAQDTSPAQWQVLQHLILALLTPDTLQRTLFVVGDSKQSIYSFQGAKPTLFNKLHLEFKRYLTAQERRWHDIDLDVSFRTTPAVLAVIDEIFKRNPHGVQFLSGNIRHISHRHNVPGLVEIWPPIETEIQSEETCWPLPLDQKSMVSGGAHLADQIASKIDALLKSQDVLPSTQKPVTPGDILILFRRRADWIPFLLQSLKKRAIPVAGVDRLRLKDHIAVLDLLALGRFLCLPQDDYSLACVLKSPLVNKGQGLSEDQLFRVCYNRKGSLWQSLLEHDNPLSQQIVVFLKKWLARVDFDEPFVLFHDILKETEGAFKARLGAECQEILSEFLQQALNYQHHQVATLQDFIDFMDSQETDIKRSVSLEANQVRLMTIHGAKGLQAPVVILADSGDHPTLQNDLFIWDDEEAPLFLLKPSQKKQSEVFASLKSKSLDQATQEQRRLLYVALTRSQDQLFIAGLVKRSKPGEWYDLLNEVLKTMGKETLEGGWIFQPAPFQKSTTAPPLRQDFEVPTWLTQYPDQALWLSKPKEPSLKEPITDQQTRGILMHRLLEIGVSDFTDVKDWCNRYDPLALISQQDQDNLMKILTHPDYHVLFGPHSVAEVDVKGDNFVGRIDRLAVTDTTAFIVDYKTGAVSKALSTVYKEQLKQYAHVVQNLYPHHSVRTFLLWTEGPKLIEISLTC